MSADLLAVLGQMKHSPLGNYGGIPGLTSWLIGAPSGLGLVRLMECSRDHFEPIIPHSHRFDFRCEVLSGKVTNILWDRHDEGDEYRESLLTYGGAPGEYAKTGAGASRWQTSRRTYIKGEEYAMRADQVHSIFFSRGAAVLFFEGPPVTADSLILEPIVDGIVIPTFDVKPWAFLRTTGGAA